MTIDREALVIDAAVDIKQPTARCVVPSSSISWGEIHIELGLSCHRRLTAAVSLALSQREEHRGARLWLPGVAPQWHVGGDAPVLSFCASWAIACSALPCDICSLS